MRRIPFNIAHKELIESGKEKVVSLANNNVTIIKWDAPGDYPIIGMFDNGKVDNYSTEGKCIDERFSDIYIMTDEPDFNQFEATVDEILKENFKYTAFTEDTIKSISAKLLSAAKKEIIAPTKDDDVLEALKTLNLRIIDIAEEKPKSERRYWEQAYRLTNTAINSIQEKVNLNC